MSKPTIEYRHNLPLDPQDVVRVFDASGITRPTKDLARIARMFAPPALTVSAWDGTRLVGVSRSLTDYAYCCYLSDLAERASFARPQPYGGCTLEPVVGAADGAGFAQILRGSVPTS